VGYTQPPIQWVPVSLSLGISTQDLKLTTHLHLVPRSRMSGTIPPLSYTSSLCGTFYKPETTLSTEHCMRIADTVKCPSLLSTKYPCIDKTCIIWIDVIFTESHSLLTWHTVTGQDLMYPNPWTSSVQQLQSRVRAQLISTSTASSTSSSKSLSLDPGSGAEMPESPRQGALSNVQNPRLTTG
jgi:hypothetical protein